MTTLDRGLEVLACIAQNGPTTADAISERSGLPISTTYRYLTALRQRGYVADYEGHFDLGLRMLRMLRPSALQRCLAAISTPVMFDLVGATGETVLLTVREGWSATCIEIVEPHRAVRFSFRKGISLSLHRGASAKPLLAYMDPGFVRTYLENRVGWAEADELQALWTQLADVRKGGFCTTTSELDEHAVGIGAPVFWDGDVAACLSVVGPTTRLPDKRVREVVPQLQEAAARLGDCLSEQFDEPPAAHCADHEES